MHTLLQQIWMARQACPQLPQFSESVVVSTQTPLHEVLPNTEQARTSFVSQDPPEHHCVDPHGCPQLPQFALLVWVSTHAPPQLVWPELHTTVHVPPEQICPAGQAWLHKPQFEGSDCVDTQAPLQFVWPDAQEGAPAAHWPFWQNVPALQATPQEPQLLLSV